MSVDTEQTSCYDSCMPKTPSKSKPRSNRVTESEMASRVEALKPLVLMITDQMQAATKSLEQADRRTFWTSCMLSLLVHRPNHELSAEKIANFCDALTEQWASRFQPTPATPASEPVKES